MGHGGGRWPQKKVTGGQTSTGQGFSAISGCPGQDFDPFEVIFSGFQRQTPPKTLKLGETKVGTGFSTLKIGGYHVVSPLDPLLLTERPLGQVPGRVRAHGNPDLGPRARAHVAGPAPEAFGSTKVGPKGWKHGTPLFRGC